MRPHVSALPSRSSPQYCSRPHVAPRRSRRPRRHRRRATFRGPCPTIRWRSRAPRGSCRRPRSDSSTTCTRTSTCTSTVRRWWCPRASASTSAIPRCAPSTSTGRSSTAASTRRAPSRASRRCTRTTSAEPLHTESATRKNNTLGQFFTEWGVKLDQSCVATYCAPATASRDLRQRREVHRRSPGDSR